MFSKSYFYIYTSICLATIFLSVMIGDEGKRVFLLCVFSFLTSFFLYMYVYKKMKNIYMAMLVGFVFVYVVFSGAFAYINDWTVVFILLCVFFGPYPLVLIYSCNDSRRSGTRESD